MRVVFAGTPEFAVPCLKACLAADVELAAVYTQPDRPAGRGRHATASPVKQVAEAAGLIVEQPAQLKDENTQTALAAYAPDLMVVVAYGLILPRAVLAMPQYGCWNVHASVLPRWRGAAPIQRAIAAGDEETGVALMQMEAGLDTGPVLLDARTRIGNDATGGALHDRLAMLGADVLSDGLARLLAGTLPAPRPQPEAGATYAHKLDKREAQLDFSHGAAALERLVRAFDPWPVATAQVGDERLRIWSAQALDSTPDAAPGSIVRATREGIDIACAEGVLRLTRVQRAGGRRMDVADYLNARPGLRGAHD